MAVNFEAYDALLELGCGEKPSMDDLGPLIDQAQTFLCRLGDARLLNPIELALLAAVAGSVRSGSPAPAPRRPGPEGPLNPLRGPEPEETPAAAPKPRKREPVTVG